MASRLARILLIVSLAAAASWGVASWWQGRPPESLADGRDRIIKAVKGKRPCEGRLSWELAYAPYPAQPQGIGDGAQLELFAAVERLAEKLESAEGWETLGVLHLFQGQPQQAVAFFERSTGAPRSGALELSNLAAAYLDRARKQGDPADWFRAVAAADQAIASDRTLPQALFNRALALEALFLTSQAREAWQEYLKADPASDWAREARRRLEALQQTNREEVWRGELARLEGAAARGDEETMEEIARRFTGPAQQDLEEDLLGRWGDEIVAGLDASGTLDAARALSRALARVRGEHAPADAVAAIDQAFEEAPDRVRALARGHSAYRDARRLHERNENADDLFLQARNAFSLGMSPAAEWAALHLATARMESRIPEAREALAALGRHLPDRYPHLLGRTYWALGMTQLALGDPVASLESYRSALRRLEALGAVEDAAGVRNVLAENLLYLGDWSEVWKSLYENLASTPQIRSKRRLLAILDQTAETCERAGLWEAAAEFRNEVVRVAHETEDPVKQVHALLERSGSSFRAGDSQAALADLEQAQIGLTRISDARERRRIAADLQIVEGEVKVGDDPGQAITALSGALAFYGGTENRFPLTRIYLARARAYHALKEPELAGADYRRGIAEFESQRTRVPEESLQISFFEQSQALFRESAALEVDRKEFEKAFDLAERWRARALLDRLIGLQEGNVRAIAQATPALGADEIRRALPEHVAVLQYAVLEDRLLLWVVRADRLHLVEIAVSSRSIESSVRGFRDALSGASRRSSGEDIELYDLLVRPALPFLEPRDRIVFVPDRSLHEVSFAALRDRTTGRYLVEDRVSSVAPSASFYVAALKRDRALSRKRGAGLLAVGNPRFRRSSFPWLEELEVSEKEAAALAAKIPGSELLAPQEATKSRFLARVGRFEVVHFAGHAVVNGAHPVMSYLVMAPDGPSDSGALYAHELYGARLDRTRLVVLAACSTASGPASGEGVQSLARAFLAAGAPAVVASLWNVDDPASAKLFETFHARLLAGEDAAAALRFAQVQSLSSRSRGARSPQTWAAFEVLGGAAPPERSTLSKG